LRIDSRIIGDIVSMAHKRVDRTQGVAFLCRQHHEAVIEILGCTARDAPADRVSMAELMVHRSLPAAARATSSNLRVLEIVGRESNTSKPWRSMALRISCPPRLNSSMSMASSR